MMTMDPDHDVERIDAWQCIGCGRISGPQTCIGVCRDRHARFVDAADFDALAAETAVLRRIARDLMTITPREGEWERAYRALQGRARALLRGSA